MPNCFVGRRQRSYLALFWIAGNVPALILDDGTLLNEGAAVLQAIAGASSPETSAGPGEGTRPCPCSAAPDFGLFLRQRPPCRADMKPGTVAPSNGTKDRYLVQTVLNYTASEAHGELRQQ